MIEEILPGLYKVEIPLPGIPLESVNSYMVKTRERNLIVDTGLNRKECIRAMQGSLERLGIDLLKTDFFITHLHIDHLGLVSSLATNTSKVYFSRPDARWIGSSAVHWNKAIEFFRMHGFPESELKAILSNHPGYKYEPRDLPVFTILKEGDIVDIGEYVFRVIETPGHTMGHMCLYEPKFKMFVSGDHILGDITPTIQSWSNEGNPLKDYMASLEKVYELDIRMVLPGHRRIFRNSRERIEELRRHHANRLTEVISILTGGRKNAFRVASEMKWDVEEECGSWDLFPVLQKTFATTEAIAHLRYLEEKDEIKSEIHDQEIIFSLI